MEITIRPGNTLATLQRELEAGQNSGNFHLVTATKVRLAILTGDPAKIDKTIMEEMGISVQTVAQDDGTYIATRTDGHSFNALMRTMRGAFDVISAVAKDGRAAIKIF